MMMQFTTMSGTKTPRVAYMAGMKAFITSSTMTTGVAIRMTNMGMRIWSGVIFRMADTRTLEKVSTNMTAMPIQKPLTTRSSRPASDTCR